MPEWRNRITRSGDADPEELVPNPRNWRIHPAHQSAALRQALERVGWVQQVIVNESTGRVVDGHLRLSLALEEGERSIPVDYVELDEDEEQFVLATLDPLAGLAITDAERLAEIREGLEELDGDVGGMVDDLIARERELLESAEANGEGEDSDEQDFWPVIRVQVPPETYKRWQDALAAFGGNDAAEAVGRVLVAALERAEERQRA